MFRVYLSICVLLVVCGVVTRKMVSTEGEMKQRSPVKLVLVDESYIQTMKEEV